MLMEIRQRLEDAREEILILEHHISEEKSEKEIAQKQVAKMTSELQANEMERQSTEIISLQLFENQTELKSLKIEFGKLKESHKELFSDNKDLTERIEVFEEEHSD